MEVTEVSGMFTAKLKLMQNPSHSWFSFELEHSSESQKYFWQCPYILNTWEHTTVAFLLQESMPLYLGNNFVLTSFQINVKFSWIRLKGLMFYRLPSVLTHSAGLNRLLKLRPGCKDLPC